MDREGASLQEITPQITELFLVVQLQAIVPQKSTKLFYHVGTTTEGHFIQ